MKKVIIQKGLYKYVNGTAKKESKDGLDLSLWLYRELKKFHLNPVNDCCGDVVIPPTVDTDTTLVNPHVVGPNLVFDKLDVITNVITPNFLSIPTVALNIATTLNQVVSTGIINYTNELGVIQSANVISTDTGNLIQVGTDGGSLFREFEDYYSAILSGNTVVLTNVPTNNPMVFRNGLYQKSGVDYTLSGVTITFNIPFGLSNSGTNSEIISIKYNY